MLSKFFTLTGQQVAVCIVPIEEKLMNEFGPFVANTHTETTVSELR
jgi:hypothetical protein